jgi:hypothetical protein
LYHLGQRKHPRPELPILRTKTPLAVVYAISGGACTDPWNPDPSGVVNALFLSPFKC